MWHKTRSMGNPVRIQLTDNGQLNQLPNPYTIAFIYIHIYITK